MREMIKNLLVDDYNDTSVAEALGYIQSCIDSINDE